MAKFGVDVTNMSPADTKAAKYISSGVQDNSAAIGIQTQTGLIQNMSEIGGALYQGAALAEANDMVQLTADKYSETSPTALNRQLKATAEKRSQLAPEDTEGLDLLGKEQIDLINKFSLATKQGTMSPEEVKVRIEADVRKTSNKWGMTKAVMQQYDQALKLVGLEGLMAGDEALRKSQNQSRSAYESYVIDTAKTTNTELIMSPTGGINFEATHANVNKVIAQKAVIDAGDRKTKVTEQELSTGGYQYLNGKSQEAIKYMVDLSKDPKMNQQDILTSARAISAETINSITSKMASILHTPTAKAYLDNFKAQQEAYLSLIQKASSKEDAVNLSNNMLKILENDDSQALFKKVSPKQMEMTTKLLAALGPGYLTTANSDALVDATRALSALSKGLGSSEEEYSSYRPNPATKSILATEAITQFITTAGHKESTPEDIKQLNNSINTVNIDTSNMDIPDKFMFYRKYTEMFASEKSKQGLTKLDSSSKSMATNHVSEYATILLTDFNRKINSPELKKENIQIGPIPGTGVLDVRVPTNKALEADLRKRYFKGINDSIQAQMNINGTTDRAAFTKEFFNKNKQLFIGGQ